MTPYINIVTLFILSLCLSHILSIKSSEQIYEGFRNDRYKNRITTAVAASEKPTDTISLIPTLSVVNKKRILSFILTTTFTSIIVSVMSLPLSLSTIIADTGFYSASIKSSLFSKIVSTATISTVCNKFSMLICFIQLKICYFFMLSDTMKHLISSNLSYR